MDNRWSPSGLGAYRYRNVGSLGPPDLAVPAWIPSSSLDSTLAATNAYLPPVPDDSRRTLQNRISTWGFPSKQHNPVYQNERIIARVSQLWEENRSHGEMLRILEQEGLRIGTKELQRLRSKNGLLLRNPNGDKAQVPSSSPNHPPASPIGMLPPGTASLPMTSVTSSRPTAIGYHDEGSPSPARENPLSPPPQVQSGPPGKCKRRRRRARAWDGHPADPAGAPRYASETTLEQAKQDLGLDAAGYQATRDTFQRFCAGFGILRKKDAGDELWDSIQVQLVREVPALQDPAGDASPEEVQKKRKVALNAICHDVMKRMRGDETRMTVTEAKSVLGLNPDRTKQVRTAFRDIVEREGAGVACKSKAGAAVWDGWVQKWMRESAIIRRVLEDARGPDDDKLKRRALETLATDVMKRVRDVRKKGNILDGKRPANDTLAEHVNTDEEATSSLGGSPPLLSGSQEIQASSSAIHGQVVDAADRMLPLMAAYDHVSPMPAMPGTPSMSSMSSMSAISSMLANPASSVMNMPAAMGLHTPGPTGNNAVGGSPLVTGGHSQHSLMSPLGLDTQAGMTLSPQCRLNPQMFLDSSPTPSFVDNQFAAQFAVSPSAPVFPPQSHLHHHHSHSHSHTHAHAHAHGHPVETIPAMLAVQRSPRASGVSVYLRPHPDSEYVSRANMYIATLGNGFTLEDLRQVACDKYGSGMCVGVGGVWKDVKGDECLVTIGADQELAAYLELLGGRDTPIFEVQMAGVRWASGLQ